MEISFSAVQQNRRFRTESVRAGFHRSAPET
jgi:hypothetical protein